MLCRRKSLNRCLGRKWESRRTPMRRGSTQSLWVAWCLSSWGRLRYEALTSDWTALCCTGPPLILAAASLQTNGFGSIALPTSTCWSWSPCYTLCSRVPGGNVSTPFVRWSSSTTSPLWRLSPRGGRHQNKLTCSAVFALSAVRSSIPADWLDRHDWKSSWQRFTHSWCRWENQ